MKLKFTLLALIAASALFMLPIEAQADKGEFDFVISHRFQVKDDGVVDVRHDVSVKNKKNSPLGTVELALPVSRTGEVKVRYSDGANIPYSTVQKSSPAGGAERSYTGLVLDFPQENRGQGRTWSFRVEYDTEEGIYDNGTSRVLLMPFLDGRIGADWSANVMVPRGWPLLNYRPPVTDTAVTSRTQLSFSSRDYPLDILGLSFSENESRYIGASKQLRNSSLLPRLVPLTLPLDLHSQSVELENLSIPPTSMGVDVDGNIIAYYRLWPLQRKTVSYQMRVDTRQLRYDTSKAGSMDDVPEELSAFISRGKYWTTQGLAGETATELVKPKDNAWKNVVSIVEYVQESVEYRPAEEGRLTADEALNAGGGNAENIADTVVAMLRSQGIPARLIYGAVMPSAGLSDEIQAHVWVEAYVSGIGWVHLDPVWSNLFGSLGSIGSDRIGLVSVSGDDQRELVRSLNANLRAETIARDEEEKEEEESEEGQSPLLLSAHRYVVFPGVNLYSRTLENITGLVIDEVSLEARELGSLAPYQVFTARTWQFGGPEGGEVTALVGGEEISADIRVVWWPLIVPVLMGIVVGVIQFYRRRQRKYLRRRLSYQTS